MLTARTFLVRGLLAGLIAGVRMIRGFCDDAGLVVIVIGRLGRGRLRLLQGDRAGHRGLTDEIGNTEGQHAGNQPGEQPADQKGPCGQHVSRPRQ